jgi:plastocyanin
LVSTARGDEFEFVLGPAEVSLLAEGAPQPLEREVSSSSTPTPSGAPELPLDLAADPEGALKYNGTSLTARAGQVSIIFTNMAALAHNVTIEDSSGAVLGATPTFRGATKT